MIPLYSNLIIQIVAFTAFFTPYLVMIGFGIYKCVHRRQKLNAMAFKRTQAGKTNDFSLNDFEGDNAKLGIHNTNNYGGNDKTTIELLQKVIERLYKEKDEQAEVIATLQNEVNEFKYYNSPNILNLIELPENRQRA